MLVLTLKLGERAMVGENIEIVLIETRGKQVKLGFDAPRDIEIDRGIVRKRKNAERALLARRPRTQEGT